MNIGDKVKIKNDPELLQEVGLEVIIEQPGIFDRELELKATWNDGWWDIGPEEGTYNDMLGYAFPEELLIKQ